MVSQCIQCQTHISSHPREPLISKPKPARPFQGVAADFCYNAGRINLVDFFTDWPTVIPMGKSATALDTITAARELFSHTAVPDMFWSDGVLSLPLIGFRVLLRSGDSNTKCHLPIIHRVTGRWKPLLRPWKKSFMEHGRKFLDDRLCKGLLQYRNTPSVRDGLSSTQKLFGHPMQDTLPAHPKSFSQEWLQTEEETECKAIATQQHTRNYYDKVTHPLSDIQQGSHIVLQNPRSKLWDTYGIVVSVDQKNTISKSSQAK